MYAKRIIASVFLIVTLFMPIQAFAHDAYFLQVLIDNSLNRYQGNVVRDDESMVSRESKHIEATLADFSGIKNNTGIMGNFPITNEGFSIPEESDGQGGMVFTFPAKEFGYFGGVNHATVKDVDRVYLIQETLVPGLNDALRILNQGKAFNSTQELLTMSQRLAQGQSVNGYTIEYGKRARKAEPLKKADLDLLSASTTSEAEKSFVLITRTDANSTEEYEFIYRMPKGYKDNQPLYDPKWSDADGLAQVDAQYITWQQLMYQANYTFTVEGKTMADAADFVKPNPLEEAVAGLLQNTLSTIRSLLGFYAMEDLVYNQGFRRSSAWYYGIMPKEWGENVIAYHWIFQAIAWSLIMLAILRALIRKNISTMNPTMRASMIDSVKDLLITAFFLANVFPLLNIFMFLNLKFVNLFGALPVDFSNLAAVNNYSNLLGAVVLQVFYFIVALYFNFFYTMRAITIAILIASAPLFIVTLAFGDRWRGLFDTWIKELLINIFIQSIHAFVLSFFVTITTSSRGIETLVIAFALIPLTEWFKSLVGGSAGGFAGAMGMKAVSQGALLARGAASMGGKGRQGSASKKTDKSSEGGGEADSAYKDNARIDNTRGGDSEDLINRAEVNKDREVPFGKAYNERYDNRMTDKQVDPKAVADAKALKTGRKIASGVAKAGWGAAKALTGVGVGLAMGGMSPEGARMGAEMVGSGFSTMKEGLGGAGGTISEAWNSSGRSQVSDHIEPLKNGDYALHHNYDDYKGSGIIRATEDSEDNSVYTYDWEKLSAEDQHNLGRYIDMYTDGEESREWLKKNGVERVSKNKDDQLMIAYNAKGKEQIGVKKVATVGSGTNARIVETKHSYDPIETAKSYHIPDAPPPQDGDRGKGRGHGGRGKGRR